MGGGAVHENKRAQSGDQHAAAGQAAGGGREWQEGARRGVRECAWRTCAVDSVGASRTMCGGAKTTSGDERGMEEEEEEEEGWRREEKRARPLAIGINLDLRVSVQPSLVANLVGFLNPINPVSNVCVSHLFAISSAAGCRAQVIVCRRQKTYAPRSSPLLVFPPASPPVRYRAEADEFGSCTAFAVSSTYSEGSAPFSHWQIRHFPLGPPIILP